MSEPQQNTSTSVTNMAEYLAPELIQRHFPRRLEELPQAIFVEQHGPSPVAHRVGLS